MKSTDFAQQLSRYLGLYLPGQAGFSPHTIAAYRDAFSLFLRYCDLEHGLSPEKITLSHVDDCLVKGFLVWLEDVRGVSVSTRNHRLAALHGFFRYLQYELPHMLLQIQKILAIPYKKAPQAVIAYLSLDAIKLLLSMPNMSTKQGTRDGCLLCLLYDTGARVSELCTLKLEDVRLSKPVTIRLTGKGNKARLVPIMTPTVVVLEQYIGQLGKDIAVYGKVPLFCNRAGAPLTRAGVAYILKKYHQLAQAKDSVIMPDQISPHCLRHSKAMHLLQAGVNLVYIRDLLGHTDVATTEIYARTDEQFKRKALETAYPSPSEAAGTTSWQNDSDLISWLKGLGK